MIQELTIHVNQIDFRLQNLALSRCKGIFVTVIEEIFSTFIFYFHENKSKQAPKFNKNNQRIYSFLKFRSTTRSNFFTDLVCVISISFISIYFPQRTLKLIMGWKFTDIIKTNAKLLPIVLKDPISGYCIVS